MLNRAQKFIETGQYDRAMEIYMACIEKEQDHLLAYAHAIVLLINLDLHEDAQNLITAFKKMLSIGYHYDHDEVVNNFILYCQNAIKLDKAYQGVTSKIDIHAMSIKCFNCAELEFERSFTNNSRINFALDFAIEAINFNRDNRMAKNLYREIVNFLREKPVIEYRHIWEEIDPWPIELYELYQDYLPDQTSVNANDLMSLLKTYQNMCKAPLQNPENEYLQLKLDNQYLELKPETAYLFKRMPQNAQDYIDFALQMREEQRFELMTTACEVAIDYSQANILGFNVNRKQMDLLNYLLTQGYYLQASPPGYYWPNKMDEAWYSAEYECDINRPYLPIIVLDKMVNYAQWRKPEPLYTEHVTLPMSVEAALQNIQLGRINKNRQVTHKQKFNTALLFWKQKVAESDNQQTLSSAAKISTLKIN